MRPFRLAACLFAAAFLGSACDSRPSRGNDDSPAPVPAAAGNPAFGKGTTTGTVAHAALTEISGLTPSRKSPGVLWAHNDSGDSARMFAMNTSGTHLGVYTFGETSAIDWEDMAIGPGPVAGESYLYAGDIGDNLSKRPGIVVYRAAEPAASVTQPAVTVTLTDVVRFLLTYPDGPHNAETLLVDPVSGDLFIVTKHLLGISGVYRKPAPHVGGESTQLTLVATLKFGSESLPGNTMVTGGDISPQGDLIALRTYNSAFLWTRDQHTPLWEAFPGTPIALPLHAERQGEALGFTFDGRGYFTVSEGTSQPLHLFSRTD